jgi:hypothetical protein
MRQHCSIFWRVLSNGFSNMNKYIIKKLTNKNVVVFLQLHILPRFFSLSLSFFIKLL